MSVESWDWRLAENPGVPDRLGRRECGEAVFHAKAGTPSCPAWEQTVAQLE